VQLPAVEEAACQGGTVRVASRGESGLCGVRLTLHSSNNATGPKLRPSVHAEVWWGRLSEACEVAANRRFYPKYAILSHLTTASRPASRRPTSSRASSRRTSSRRAANRRPTGPRAATHHTSSSAASHAAAHH
jgi:hypothetical protein